MQDVNCRCNRCLCCWSPLVFYEGCFTLPQSAVNTCNIMGPSFNKGENTIMLL